MSLEERVLRVVRRVVGEPLAVVIFGSSVYRGDGRDIDLLVVIEKLPSLHEKFRLEHMLRVELLKEVGRVFDPHVFDRESLEENMEVGSFLSGLALGYSILVDNIGFEKLLEKLFEKLAGNEYILVNRYGVWHLRKHALAKLMLLKRRRVEKNLCASVASPSSPVSAADLSSPAE